MSGQEDKPTAINRVRCRFEVRGRVQGVGFRPFVYRLARDLRLGGLAGNDTHGAFIEIEGPAEAVDRFVRRLRSELPPLARISELVREAIAAHGESEFRIEHSQHIGIQDAEIAPDVATCPQCLAELFDPRDRRHRYPFINCTNCGPRYSIIQGVPYDRPNTTMRRFRMCPACQAEYDDPADRRFHAQPNACPVCGPRVWLTDKTGRECAGDPIAECGRLLDEGRIIAVKGIGGFHLACRADNDRVVEALRDRKGREAKPLAVMVDSLETAGRLAAINPAAAEVLSRPERPIALLELRDSAPISRQVAPDLDRIGIMLPYTPLHHLLLQAGPKALVMTSGNPTEEPLCRENSEALRRLGHIADGLLLHDRDIERRVDDSAVLISNRPDGRALPIRRARGFSPAPIELAFESDRPVLAVGGELKSTVCLLTGNQAVVSEHLGELPNAETYRHFIGSIEQFKRLLRIEPAVVAADLHPDYAATRYAEKLGLPVVKVQHHHAHLVSCMAENGLTGRVLGLICDGTGYGTDGAIWGCEVLAGDGGVFERLAHLSYYPLPGGDAGAKQTWRPAAGLLSQIEDDFAQADPEAFARVPTEALNVTRQRLEHGSLVRTSSLGRLFDAVAFLLGIRDENRYEAEAAMMLEAAARRAASAEPLPYTIVEPRTDSAAMQIDVRPMLVEIIKQRLAGRATPELARAFHETIATMLSEATVRAARRTMLNSVVLSGGCMLNDLLGTRLCELLTSAGLQVFEHQQVPPGDGGISLGQAVAATTQSA
ncbi:MAG TPA: carbamoyltransferase HypF [Phycisphaerae bacterium]|nr:carbamoyltransferase HypF [Phycisphaerae bacterium]